MSYWVTVRLLGADGELIESYTRKVKTQQEIDTEIKLLRLKYPATEIDLIDKTSK